MPLVTVGVGITLKIGDPYGNNYFKANLEIRDIDTALSLEEQLADSKTYMNDAFEMMTEKLSEAVEEQTGNKV